MNGQLLAGCPVPLCVLPGCQFGPAPCLVLYDTGGGVGALCVWSKLWNKRNRSFSSQERKKKKLCKTEEASRESVFHLATPSLWIMDVFRLQVNMQVIAVRTIHV